MESKHLRFWGSVILASGVFVLFGIIIPNNLWFLISIPIMVMVAGIALIVSSYDDRFLQKKDPSNKTVTKDILNGVMNSKQELSPLNAKTPARTKTDAPLSHDSEEYRKWKEGK